jgi:signal peptidase I
MAISKDDIFSLFWFLLLVIFLRTFVVEPFQIPSDSMNPTLLRGDHLLVAKSAYDITIPFSKFSLSKVSDPARGDVIVFKYPNFENNRFKEDIFYIKRIVGVPGDKILIHGGSLFINDQKVDLQKPAADFDAKNALPSFSQPPETQLAFEALDQKTKHWILYRPENLQTARDLETRYQSEFGTSCLKVGSFILDRGLGDFRKLAENEICEFVVPPENYFALGDSRSDSEDGRFWGFVDRHQIRGKALFIFLALRDGVEDPALSVTDGKSDSYFDWKRFGLAIR